jgi:hypothetical protein
MKVTLDHLMRKFARSRDLTCAEKDLCLQDNVYDLVKLAMCFAFHEARLRRQQGIPASVKDALGALRDFINYADDALFEARSLSDLLENGVDE